MNSPSTGAAPVTVVTGASRGIGRHLAEHYLARGHRVIGVSRKAPEKEPPGSYTHHELDVADEAQVTALFSGLRRNEGRLDHLINNAGIASMNHVLTTPAASVDRVLRTNVVGTFLFCKAAARLMRKAGYGRIVNVSTVAVPLKLAGEAAYIASKAAVESLTQVLAREFSELGITVNAVGPVPIETDLTRGISQQKLDALVARQAIARMGDPADVANVIDFFLRPESTMVTGQVVYLGGP